MKNAEFDRKLARLNKEFDRLVKENDSISLDGVRIGKGPRLVVEGLENMPNPTSDELANPWTH